MRLVITSSLPEVIPSIALEYVSGRNWIFSIRGIKIIIPPNDTDDIRTKRTWLTQGIIGHKETMRTIHAMHFAGAISERTKNYMINKIMFVERKFTLK